MNVLELRGISKFFRGPEGKIQALADVSLSIIPGQFVAVHGPSGCGKTTLLLIAGGLLEPDSGEVLIDHQNLYRLAANQRSTLRAEKVGFVFQQIHLVPYLSVLDNILAPSIATVTCGASEQTTCEALERAKELLYHFKLEHRTNHVPDQLSVGEQQRTAMARAMLNNPEIILADEPTGNLDVENRNVVLAFLDDFISKAGSVLIVTHDSKIAQYAHKNIELRHGRIASSISPYAHQKVKRPNNQ